ncbi:transmembrane protein 242-like [Saccostrea echinata]|uniref:transmembrane protein 242-like n=1 Tax=Saccostrea echinata TaxID=191078 RepID=UPI002A7F1714|nr:transmembrane protein 242-like [Saccostrea echinata]
MAPPIKHVMHADGKEGGIDQVGNSQSTTTVIETADEKWNRRKENFKKGFLLTSVVGLATYFQFKSAYALAAKKGDGSTITPVNIGRAEMKWASKALAYGTILAISGTGLVCFLVKKAMGVNNLIEFKERMHEIFPQAKKSPKTGDESENIETVEDFIKYITEDKKKKTASNNSNSEDT